MAIIYSYPINTNILATDIIIGSSTVTVNGSPKNQTKSFKIQDLSAYFASILIPPGSYVPYTGAIGPVNLGSQNLTANSIIKAGGTAVQYLMANGTVTTTPTIQQVVDAGNTIVVPTTVTKGIDITLVDLATVYQNGVSVTIPAQTGIYPAFSPAPDAFVANINGQNPGNLTGTPVGFLTNVAGEDNIAFFADLTATSGSSRGFETISFDAHTGDYFRARKQISGIETIPFKVANNGDTTANSFIKIGGTSEQFLMANGSVTTNGTLFSAVSTTYQTAAGALQSISAAIPSSIFTNGNLLKLNAAITTTAASVAIVVIEFYINSAATISGATLIGRYNGPIGNLYIPIDRFFWVSGATLYGRDFTASASTSTSNSAFAINSVAIPATQFYIITQATTTSADRACLSTIKIEKS